MNRDGHPCLGVMYSRNANGHVSRMVILSQLDDPFNDLGAHANTRTAVTGCLAGGIA